MKVLSGVLGGAVFLGLVLMIQHFSLTNVELVKSASLEIIVNPNGAEIRLGDQYQAVEKLLVRDIPPGIYQLEASRQGFETHHEKITIAEEESLTREVSLTPLVFKVKFDSQPQNVDYVSSGQEARCHKGKNDKHAHHDAHQKELGRHLS